ncbi:FAD/NAD(P)-binding protein [Lacticaseibacillus brantae]|uniref:FAD(NAD)-dependent oxidoreductase n=1 Tax=Lacticaseibacillus brantae DSM 23927 TaxID=1423727 RepID=A0A0R2AXW9_9LACO|nr:FAD/NAD(P)-binding protein [Lacticaseibacillus brantae]KRM71743.1 FAD(NAD)-dependent oxidoreductase [Lacticaseibacillus brantae DSM 23927]
MHIALIGAGPRGMLILERLLAWQTAHYPETELSIDLFDPYGIGGRVWQVDQPHELIMNTATQQITLFYDRSVAANGPQAPGLDLADWAAGVGPDYIKAQGFPDYLAEEAAGLGPNDYASRALYGAYIHWVYAELNQRKQANTTITLHQVPVSAVQKHGEQFQVTATDGVIAVDEVVMALGNLENTPTREQEQLADFAAEHQLTYIQPGFPNEADLSTVAAGDNVIVRGLGLSFFDFMARFTIGRGGHFDRQADGHLTYVKNGKEPHIIAGSRRGFPYRAKGRNQKGPGEEWPPQFLTDAQIETFQKQGHITGQEFWTLLQHEVEYIYYTLLIEQSYPEIDVATFQAEFKANPEGAVAAIPSTDQLDWQALQAPLQSAEPADFKTFMLAYLQDDAAAAEQGTKTGPLTSALEVLRDMRDPIRQIIERELLTDDQYLDFFLRWFNPLNDFLSIGPPVIRIEQLAALVDAGIVTLLAPGMTVETEADHFVVGTTSNDTTYTAKALFEARVPAVSAPTAINPLMQQLLTDQYASLYALQLQTEKRFQSGAVNVDRKTNQLLNSSNHLQAGLYFWGVPTEGVHWLTTASPRPLVNDVSLRTADQMVESIWSTQAGH